MSSPQRRERGQQIANAALERLVELFPKAFVDWKKNPRPLKLGIYTDIRRRVPDMTAKHINIVLHRYTSTNRYLQAMIAGAQRFDLDGESCGHVTTEHEVIAAAQLRDRRKLNAGVKKPASEFIHLGTEA